MRAFMYNSWIGFLERCITRQNRGGCVVDSLTVHYDEVMDHLFHMQKYVLWITN